MIQHGDIYFPSNNYQYKKIIYQFTLVLIKKSLIITKEKLKRI